VPRSEAGAVLHSIDAAVEQGVRLARDGRVRTVGGRDLEVRVDSICVHGDTPGAIKLIRALRAAMSREGITVTAFAP